MEKLKYSIMAKKSLSLLPSLGAAESAFSLFRTSYLEAIVS